MTNQKKHIAVSGYYGFENFGDEAILKVLASELKNNHFDVTVFSKNPETTATKLDVKSVYTFDIKKIITTLKESDVLISGGGSLLQDATSLKSLFYYLFVIYAAQFLRKDVIIFAQGIGPIRNFIGKFLTKRALKNCAYITVRDEKSLSLLKEWAISSDLVSDPVWNLDTNDYQPSNRVGIQLRNWKSISDKFLYLLAEQINKHFSDKEIYIYSFQDALDFDICKKFESQLKNINQNIKTKLIPALNTDDTINSFANLDYLIAMRYHACLLALKYGIPTLALSYDEKVEKIAKRFEIPCSFLKDDEDFESMFNSLKSVDSLNIREKAKECKFSFEKILKAIIK